MPDFGSFLASGGLPKKGYLPEVLETEAFRRIRDMPRRDWKSDPDMERWRQELTAFCKTPHGTQELKPVQAAALRDLRLYNGAVCPIRTGGGKTLTSLLAQRVLGVERAVLFVPASLRDKTHREKRELAYHWQLTPTRVMSYQEMGHVSRAKALEIFQPQLIVADECHFLKNTDAGVTKLIRRYVEKFNPAILLMSGSITSRSLREYWHLLRWCLGRDSMPLPSDPMELQQWCWALDSKVSEFQRIGPGALLEISPPDPSDDRPDADGNEPSERLIAQRRYGRRLLQTPGVVGNAGDMPQVGLICNIDRREPSAAVAEAVRHMRATWETPGGEPFETAMDLWRHEREISNGLYQRFKVSPPLPWKDARKQWSVFVRETLAHSRSLATPMAVAQALLDGTLADPYGLEALTHWQSIRDSFKPETEAVWIDDSALQYAAAWLQEHKGICWVYHVAFGEMLSRGTGVPYFHEQGRASNGKVIDQWDGPAIASATACITGFNLQKLHYRNLVMTAHTKNGPTEQQISRTHRDGSDWDDVYFTWYQVLEGDQKALAQARADAQVVEATLQEPQRLTVATWLN